eukprot:TRINITY_DN4754_c0_g1_i1.p1 TRINITY_DN4754_c0_g1~~TRINITY_DN4754_c0_g1_i1.p1  ORF type:complete len:259 (+),score=94.39 TRINITY_DN4754_c0_g1_i1:42-818(+)
MARAGTRPRVVDALLLLLAACLPAPAHTTAPCITGDAERIAQSDAVWVSNGGAVHGEMVKLLEYTPTRLLEIECIAWTGFDAAGACSREGDNGRPFRGWLCAEDSVAGRRECEPIDWDRKEGRKQRLPTVTGAGWNKTTWGLYFDSAEHPAACFPRRISATSVFDFPERTDPQPAGTEGRWSLFGVILGCGLLIGLVLILLNLRAVLKKFFPEVLDKKVAEYAEKEDQYRAEADERGPGAGPGAGSPPRHSEGYGYLV